MSGSTPTASGASSVLTTKGDIVGYDTARKRIGVGSNDQVLTADSTDANGIAWKAVSGGASADDEITINGITLELQKWVLM